MRILLLSVIAISLAASPLAAQTCGLANDVNGDRRFDFADPKTLLEYLFSGGRLYCPNAADANGDGRIDIADAIAMTSELNCTAATVGDVNGSGTLAFNDVNYLLGYLFLGGLAPVPCLGVADVNGDGSVNIADALALVPLLPCPGLPGDANGDEVLDIKDFDLIGAYLFTGGPPPVPCVLAGDANQDGTVNIADMVFLTGIFGTEVCAAALLGDANQDTELDMADVKYILAYLFEGGPDPEPCVDVADYNQDGQVDIADPIALSSALCAAALPGDANANGLVDIGDLIVVVNYLFNSGPAPQPCVLAGDVNGDGAVDIADMITYLGLF